MIRGIEAVVISSENARKLAEFYRDSLGIEIKEEYEDEEGKEYFEMSAGEGSNFYINSSSDVKGSSQDGHRVMVNFEVNDAEKAAAEAESKGAKKLQDVYHIEGYGYVSMFSDPDGNHFQLAQVRAPEGDHDHKDHENHDH